jgi:6-phosphogluconolactonase
MGKRRLALIALAASWLALVGCGREFWAPQATSTSSTTSTQAVTPKFASVANFTNGGKGSVSGYVVDSAGGVSSTGSLAATENGPVGIASNSSGTFIYVANQEGGISAYSVNRTTGELTPIAGAPFSTGTSPAWVGLPADGKYLYVVNVGSHDVFAYLVNSSTGVLTILTSTATLFAGASGYRAFRMLLVRRHGYHRHSDPERRQHR